MTHDDATVLLEVNGESRRVAADSPLLGLLRADPALRGAKLGCGEGACGSCTVLADGVPIRSCHTTAAEVAGQRITTIEALTAGGAPHPVQRAFAETGAAQCGYCVPGLIMATVALLERDSDPDDAAITGALNGHLCRCGGYPGIRRAVRRAAELSARRSPDLAGGPPLAAAADRWTLAEPGRIAFRPERPWDLTEPADRDWFTLLGDGLVVVEPPLPPGSATFSTSGGAWLHVAPADGPVTGFSGKVDVGQDNRTAMRMLIAEELRVPLERIRLVQGDTDLCPHDMGTFGSRSMPDSAAALRRAAAWARELPGPVPGDRRVEIVTGDPDLTPASAWRVAGRPVIPPGIADVVTGTRRYVSELDQPGMLNAAVLRPPAAGATLRGLGAEPVRARPGVTLIRAHGVTAVLAADPRLALDALAELEAGADWELPGGPSDDQVSEYLRDHPAELPDGPGGPYRHEQGNAKEALASAEGRLEATYTAAYIAPAPLETLAAIAAWDGDRVTVWTGTQTPFPVRAQVAARLGVAEADVRIIVPPTGGGFGGRHAAGISVEAAILAREAGQPVRVVWTRREEFTAGTLRPAAVIDIAAGVTEAGDLLGWTHRTINAGRPAIMSPYQVADQLLEYQPAVSPLPQSSYRGLAATVNNFARESMMDELCAEMGFDPVEFRLRHLTDDRLVAALRAVANHIGWFSPRGGTAAGWGIACGLEKEGRVVTAARARPEPGSRGGFAVTGLVTGYDCGAVINPHTVTGQIEGATTMALGGALYERIAFTGGRVTNPAFSQYKVPRLRDLPPVEVLLLGSADEPPAGAGETPMLAVAPAIANAVFAVTGRRLRDLPLLGG